MKWNWQLANWPNFKYDSSRIADMESSYLTQAGVFSGASLHISKIEHTHLVIELLSGEAFSTSEIEGEILNRSSIQSSIKQKLGLATENLKIPQAEKGVAEVMMELYDTYKLPLTHKQLFRWHRLIMAKKPTIKDIGHYRTHEDDMQIISGPIHKPKIHFVAPPSESVKQEMDKFIKWYNTPLASKNEVLTRAAIAHLYFETIHPFEDGNGRIGRALVIKSLSQSLNQPVFIALSEVIQKNKKKYYDALASSNQSLDATGWIVYFAKTILIAQEQATRLVKHIISKARFFDKFKTQINTRQAKALFRMFEVGPNGFVGGLSAENYIRITKTSKATATRDLQELVTLGALKKEGALKRTRYYLAS